MISRKRTSTPEQTLWMTFIEQENEKHNFKPTHRHAVQCTTEIRSEKKIHPAHSPSIYIILLGIFHDIFEFGVLVSTIKELLMSEN